MYGWCFSWWWWVTWRVQRCLWALSSTRTVGGTTGSSRVMKWRRSYVSWSRSCAETARRSPMNRRVGCWLHYVHSVTRVWQRHRALRHSTAVLVTTTFRQLSASPPSTPSDAFNALTQSYVYLFLEAFSYLLLQCTQYALLWCNQSGAHSDAWPLMDSIAGRG